MSSRARRRFLVILQKYTNAYRRHVRKQKFRTPNGRRKREGKGDNAQERGDGSDGERQADETEDKGDLSPRQETLHGGDPLRVGVDKVEFASRQGRQARQVVRVEAVLLDAPRANGGARQRRIDVVTRAVDRDTLQAMAKVRIGRVRVGHEAADDARVDLV